MNFKERNEKTYIKYCDVPLYITNKYKDKLPKELIEIWQNMGFGIYENGYLQIVNPEEWEFAFDYIDKTLEPAIIFGLTALGDLLIWEGNDNWTIAPDEGNRVKIINTRICDSHIISSFDGTVNIFMQHFLTKKNYFDAKPYLEIKDTLPKLEYGQCYGYVPALALGGKKSNKNLQIVDAKTYVDMIGQAVGKIIDLS
ncbi:T6SS immunity protein Tdi1 domain-containing protein [Treponema pedis]|uniref:T6SS immunity protein Tdi1 domain-containing protein n=1 Tax=Treponema pedis TaxID=409322 RepID=UPI0004018B94|nr:T6SS immunity protein Tdi1 domain-containing protein [Treponema pedis]